MVRAFTLTGGWSNDAIHRLIAAFRPPRPMWPAPSELGIDTDEGASQIIAAIDRDGYSILPHVLAHETCDHLVKLAETLPSSVRLRPDLPAAPYRQQDPDVPAAWLKEADLAADPVVQRLASDPGVLRLAQGYLRCQPYLTTLAMWWSRPARADQAARDENAQRFHFDMDHPKWVKLFIYLTDVTEDSGPHVVVAGTHRRGSQPRSFLRQGYARHSDDSVEGVFGDRITSITGPRGTVFAADTRLLHKGEPPLRGERLVLQYEFSDSCFGAPQAPVGEVKVTDPQLWHAAAVLPGIYRRWNLV